MVLQIREKESIDFSNATHSNHMVPLIFPLNSVHFNTGHKSRRQHSGESFILFWQS